MMKNNPLDDIVKCSIEISSPASSDASFDSILLIVPEPTEEVDELNIMKKVTPISKADELLDYGFTVNDTAYKAATVAFSQSPTPSELYICIRKMTTIQEDEEIEKVYESITETLIRAASEIQFYGIHITDFKGTEDVEAAISWAEANEKMFAFEYTDYDKCPVKNFSFYRSFGIFSGVADGYDIKQQPDENKYAALAWMAKCFGYDPGTETWNMKELATIVPSALSTAQKKELTEKNINTFLRYSGCNCAIGGKTLAGEWIDVIRFRDWLKAEMQIRVFNVIKVNRKVPFTDEGIGLIEGAMEATLKKGQNIGGIATTSFDEDGTEIPGFVVKVPKASSLTEAERKSRKLTGCSYTAKLSGAIHAVEIEGFLTF